MEIGELVRKTRLSNYTRENEGLVASLTYDQFEKIKNKYRNRPTFIGEEETFDPLYSETYIHPSQVIEYFVDNENFKDSLNQEVVINFKDKWRENNMLGAPGSYVFFIQKDKKRKEILVGTISKEDILERRIESKYIKKDYSGIIIPITREVLESELNEKKEWIDNGGRENFRGVEKLAKIAEIDFSKELKEAREYDKKQYLKRYAKKEHLDNIFEMLRENFDLFLNENCLYSDSIYEFSKLAHLIEYPSEEYKNQAIGYLDMISKTFSKEAKSLKNELEGIIKEKEKKIGELENEATKVSWKKRVLQGENLLL